MFGIFKKKSKEKTSDPSQPNNDSAISPELKEQIKKNIHRRLQERNNSTYSYSGRQAGKSASYGNTKYNFSKDWAISKGFDKKDEHIVVSKKRAHRLADYEDILDEIAKDPLIAEAWQKFQTFRKMRKE